MNKNAPLTIGVIGSGVIGTLTAYTLKKKNYSVSLFDENLPGTQTSMGNAGTFAHYACIPINSEDNFKKIPFLLFSDSSPLSIQWKNLLSIYQTLQKKFLGQFYLVDDSFSIHLLHLQYLFQEISKQEESHIQKFLRFLCLSIHHLLLSTLLFLEVF